MIITAKFASTCPVCNASIAVGTKVEWSSGNKAKHVECAPTTLTSGMSPTGAQLVERNARCGTARTIAVTRDGRRSYLTGDTLSVRGLLRDGGCHWDADRKAWWIGSHDEALALAERARTATAEAAPKKRVTHCVGCGGHLDDFTQRRGFKFCSRDCVNDMRLGGQSGYVNGAWHQGSDD